MGALPFSSATQRLFAPVGRVYFGWWLVGSATTLNVITGGVYYFGFSAFFLPLQDEFHASHGAVSLSFGLSNVVQGMIVAPFLGFFIDRLGPRKVLLFGIAVVGLGYMSLALANSLVMFYILFLGLVSVGVSASQSPTAAAVANWFIKRRGTAFGVVNAGFGFGALAVVVTNFLIEQLGWRGAAAAIGIILWTVGFPLTALLRHRPEQYGMVPDGHAGASGAYEPKTSRKGKKRVEQIEHNFTLGEALHNRAFWLLFIGFSLRSGVSAGTSFHIIPAMHDKGFSADEAAALVGLFGVASIPFRLISGAMLDRFEKRYVAAVAVAIQGLAMVALVWASSLWQIVIALVLFSSGSGGTASLLQPIAGDYFGRKSYATISGVGSMISVVGMATFPTVAGYMRDATGTYTAGLLMFAVVSAAATAILMMAKRPVKPVAVEAT